MLPYFAEVHLGDVRVDKAGTSFQLLDDDGSVPKSGNITVTNDFAVPVVIYRVEMPADAQGFFEDLDHGSGPTILKPKETRKLVNLKLKPEAWKKKLLDTHLILHTNVSAVKVPLICYHGKLKPVGESLVLVLEIFLTLKLFHSSFLPHQVKTFWILERWECQKNVTSTLPFSIGIQCQSLCVVGAQT